MTSIRTPSVKTWATPMVMGAFLLSATTGLLMFFHANSGLNKLAHEWLGLALVFGGLSHAFANRSGFAKHLKNPAGKAIIGVFILLLAGSFWTPPNAKKSPKDEALNALAQAPLTVVAQVARKEPATVLARIQAAGFGVHDLKETIRAIAGRDKQQEKRLLGIVFSSGE